MGTYQKSGNMYKLITGGAGFIGHNLWKNYGGYRVDDFSKGIFECDEEMDCSSEYFTSWVKEHKPQHIIHLCGQSSGERSAEDPTNDFIRNVLTTQRLLSACDYDVKSITLASSMSVYGNNDNAKETDVPDPLSWYGKIYRKWASVFGEERICPIVMEEFWDGQVDLLEDFLGIKIDTIHPNCFAGDFKIHEYLADQWIDGDPKPLTPEHYQRLYKNMEDVYKDFEDTFGYIPKQWG